MRILLLFSCFLLLFTANLASNSMPTLTIYTYKSFAASWGPGPILKKLFEEKCNCEIKFHSTDDGVTLLNRIRIEGKKTKADLVIGLDSTLITEAKNSKLFKRTQINTSKLALPTDWKNNYFIPYNYGYYSFIYDSEKIKEPPKSFHELTSEKYRKSIIIQDPRTSNVGLGLLLWIEIMHGEQSDDIWKELKKNILTTTKSWSEAYGLFQKGEAPLVLSYTTSPAYHITHDNHHRYKAAIFPKGHYIQIEVAGLIENSQNKKLAKDFLQFLISPEAQAVIAKTNWMYPVINIGDNLPAAYKEIVEPGNVQWFDPGTVLKYRKTWIREWLNALSQ